jgi:hypothetical protein
MARAGMGAMIGAPLATWAYTPWGLGRLGSQWAALKILLSSPMWGRA